MNYLLFIYYTVLSILYHEVISTYYAYAGLITDINYIKLIESIFFIIALGNFMPRSNSRPSNFFSYVHLYIFTIPVLILYAFADQARLLTYAVILTNAISFYISKIPKIKIKLLKFNFAIIYLLTIISVYIFTISLIIKVGTENFNLKIDLEYLFRERISDIIGEGFYTYIIGWMVTIFGPTALIFSLMRKKYLQVIIVSLIHVAWFGFTSHKTPALIPLLIMTLWYYKNNLTDPRTILLLITLISIVSIIEFWVLDSYFIAATIIRRALFIPAQLTFAYHEFFENKESVLWLNTLSQSDFLRGEMIEGYQRAVGDYIGVGGHANAGFYATGFMHFKVMGLVMYSILYIILLYFIDCLTMQKENKILILTLLIIPIITLITSSDFTTTLLSHGLGISLIFVYLSAYSTSDFKTNAGAIDSTSKLSSKPTFI